MPWIKSTILGFDRGGHPVVPTCAALTHAAARSGGQGRPKGAAEGGAKRPCRPRARRPHRPQTNDIAAPPGACRPHSFDSQNTEPLSHQRAKPSEDAD